LNPSASARNGETDAPAQATAVTLAAAAAPFKIDVAHHGLCCHANQHLTLSVEMQLQF
jgi:hypothetical protein